MVVTVVMVVVVMTITTELAIPAPVVVKGMMIFTTTVIVGLACDGSVVSDGQSW